MTELKTIEEVRKNHKHYQQLKDRGVLYSVESCFPFTEEGEAATLEQFYGIVDLKKCNVSDIKVKRSESEFSDGPPCIEILAASKIAKNRNLALFHYAVFAKKKWKNWKEKVSEFHKDYMIL